MQHEWTQQHDEILTISVPDMNSSGAAPAQRSAFFPPNMKAEPVKKGN